MKKVLTHKERLEFSKSLEQYLKQNNEAIFIGYDRAKIILHSARNFLHLGHVFYNGSESKEVSYAELVELTEQKNFYIDGLIYIQVGEFARGLKGFNQDDKHKQIPITTYERFDYIIKKNFLKKLSLFELENA